MKTYKEWQDLGYGIRKGEKSKYRNDQNICLFDKTQVINLHPCFKSDDELRIENNLHAAQLLDDLGMIGKNKFVNMQLDLERQGSWLGISQLVNYGDDYDACNDLEEF